MGTIHLIQRNRTQVITAEAGTSHELINYDQDVITSQRQYRAVLPVQLPNF
jgi:hypothetical protein